jgi:predicted CoA-binding protein
MEKITLVLGASPDPSRFSYRAIKSLQRRNIPVIAIGRKEIDSGSLRIRKGMPSDTGMVHTVTLYMNASHQKEYYNYIFSLNPKRIIFNPGTKNPELSKLAIERGIEVVDECMLVMLNTGKF